jgi:hypothetical protein
MVINAEISSFVSQPLKAGRGERKLTRQPRLCDLMSRKRLAYLFLLRNP